MFDVITTVLVMILMVSFFMIYLMNIRIRQLRNELNDLRDRVAVTGEELLRLSNDIEEFKKIKI
ncbi:Uncharacterised protein [uncultured archaeon]|nr:Uncharacterised protein [uncultured archaeon]